MNTTKLLVLSGAFAHANAGETFSPPHIRMGSSAACFLVSIPPSVKVDELTVNGAAAAAPAMLTRAATIKLQPNFQQPLRIFVPPLDARKSTIGTGFGKSPPIEHRRPWLRASD